MKVCIYAVPAGILRSAAPGCECRTALGRPHIAARIGCRKHLILPSPRLTDHKKSPLPSCDLCFHNSMNRKGADRLHPNGYILRLNFVFLYFVNTVFALIVLNFHHISPSDQNPHPKYPIRRFIDDLSAAPLHEAGDTRAATAMSFRVGDRYPVSVQFDSAFIGIG